VRGIIVTCCGLAAAGPIGGSTDCEKGPFMKPILLTAGLLLSPLPALAHPGHLADLAGHSHWIALGGLALAGALAAWAARGRKDGAVQEAQQDNPEAEPETGSAEQPA